MSEHRLINDTLVAEADGVHARCVCGWDSGGRFTSLVASALFVDHQISPDTPPPPTVWRTLKDIPVQMDTVEDGDVVKSETVKFMLMPPASGLCAVCAHDHRIDEPHNAQSMYYQYAFYGEHNRWPTWADAMAHCSEHCRTEWKRNLVGLGVWSEPPEGTEPIGQAYVVQP